MTSLIRTGSMYTVVSPQTTSTRLTASLNFTLSADADGFSAPPRLGSPLGVTGGFAFWSASPTVTILNDSITAPTASDAPNSQTAPTAHLSPREGYTAGYADPAPSRPGAPYRRPVR